MDTIDPSRCQIVMVITGEILGHSIYKAADDRGNESLFYGGDCKDAIVCSLIVEEICS